MNYFPFNIGDYAAHTGHLEPMEDLAYRRLLDQYYLREGPLPADIEATAKLVRMRSMKADVESVLKEFFTLTEAGWTHGRCDQEIEHMQDKQAKARASAQHSVIARRAKSLSVGSADVNGTGNGRSTDAQEKQTDAELPTPIPTPIPREEKKTPQPPRGGCLRFEEFWTAWPKSDRKQDKVKCADKWRRTGLDAVADSILADVAKRRAGRKWLEDGGAYIEAPLTYLNGKRWEDGAEIETQQEQFV